VIHALAGTIGTNRTPPRSSTVTVALPDRDDEDAAVGQLLEEHMRRLLRRGGHDDAIEGRLARQASVAIPRVDVHVRVAEAQQAQARLFGERRDRLDRVNFRRQ
jgi:hypothetical protein